MVKPGEVIALKVTGERVFLLALEGGVATVRRPNIAENGALFHVAETFTEAEICSLKEYTEVKLTEMLEQREQQKTLLRKEMEITKQIEAEADAESESQSKVIPIN